MEQERLYEWKKQDFLILTIIPLELLVGGQLSKIPPFKDNSQLLIISGVLLFILGMLVSIWLLRDFLASEWQRYKQRLVRNVLLTIVLAAGTFVLMTLIKPLVAGSAEIAPATDGEYGIFLLTFSLIPAVIAAFAEELTFRYALFGKFKGKLTRGVMLVVSSILFGLVHLNNVDGDWLLTVPYMVMGAYFAGVYMFTKNIWFAIGTHFLYNSSISLLPVLLLILVNLFR